jgi:TonB family protein
MPALAVALALVVALPAASGPRVPGLALRFGESLARLDSTHTWQSEAAGGGGVAVRTGTARFFGVPAAVRLRFAGERLVRAEATVEPVSPRDRDFVRDELRRLGFKPACDADEPGDYRCTWSGAARVELRIGAERLHAVLEPAPPPREPVATAPPPARATPAGPPPAFALDDTLATRPYPVPRVLVRAEPVYPQIAREAGVMGRVRVHATVDSTGAVTATRIVRGVPMLDVAAAACVRKWRFQPYVLDGRAWAFEIEVPVVFTLR